MDKQQSWVLDKLLDLLSVQSAHDERIKTLEEESDKRSHFFAVGAPTWISVAIALAALAVSVLHK